MASKRRPSPEDARGAVSLLLQGVEDGGDIFDTLDEVRPLHPKNNTFPGEVFMRLAADALNLVGVSSQAPMSDEGLARRYLPEARFRRRDNAKIRYALLAVAATHGGVEVDLLDEVVYWGTDDVWSYAALASVAWIRAISDQRSIPLPQLCHLLRDRFSPKTGL